MHRSARGTALVGVRFSRGSGDRGGQAPRATVDEAASRLVRSGSGDPELQSLANRDNPINPAHLLLQVRTWRGTGPRRTGRGKAALRTRLQLIPNAHIIRTRYEFYPRKRKNDDRLFSH